MSKKTQQDHQRVQGVLGVGLDTDDGHKRITQNEDVVLVGGSEETHERMQEVSIKFNESLKARGKRVQDAEVSEVIDLLQDASAKAK
ncbi:MAG: hypothetical protein ACFCD0_08255 [Gemmataceae bacterium]